MAKTKAMPKTTLGRFVWYDLMTTDTAAAQDFYKQVVGWKTQVWEGSSQPYTMWTRGETPIGGVMGLPQAAQAPPHWLTYIATPDIEQTVRQAQQRGGKVHHPVTPIPTVGKFAVLQDPQGAFFAPFEPEQSSDGEWNPQPGDVSWNELVTSDWQAAYDFYHALFGWEKTSAMDMGPGGTYQMFGEKANGRPYGGMYNFMPDMPPMPPNWLPYVRVTNLDASVERVRKLGGQVLNGPMEVPGGDRVAQCMDPQGAAFALHEAKQS
jgi:predicted enzyme related to lactoylglutathione lyase